MIEHRPEIAKSAQARVSEEFYRLLRGGAAKRSMELLVETEMLEIFAPELARGLRPADADAEGPEAEESAQRRARLWAYLGAVDRSTARKPTPPTNALILAALLLPPLREALDPSTRGVSNVGQLIAESIAPALERLRPSRRDNDLARQLLLSLRFMLPGGNRQRRQELRGREVYEDALRLVEIITDAETLEPALGVATARADAQAGAEGAAELDDADGLLDDGALPADFDSLEDRGRGRRRGRRGQPRRDQPAEARSAPYTPSPRAASDTRGRGPLPPPTAAPIDLNGLLSETRSLLTPSARPAFLGSGAFGGPWSSRVE